MRLFLALGLSVFLAACATSKQPKEVWKDCEFWTEAPQETRLLLVRGALERVMTSLQTTGQQPHDWPAVKACVRGEYQNQVSEMDRLCHSGADAEESYKETSYAIRKKCWPPDQKPEN